MTENFGVELDEADDSDEEPELPDLDSLGPVEPIEVESHAGEDEADEDLETDSAAGDVA